MDPYPEEGAEKGKTDAEKEANRLAQNEDNAREKRQKQGKMPKEEPKKAAKDKNSDCDKRCTGM